MPVCSIVKLLPLSTVDDLMHYCTRPASCNSASGRPWHLQWQKWNFKFYRNQQKIFLLSGFGSQVTGRDTTSRLPSKDRTKYERQVVFLILASTQDFSTNCICSNYAFNKQRRWERSGSVVECLTRDRGAAGSSLTGVTALCP